MRTQIVRGGAKAGQSCHTGRNTHREKGQLRASIADGAKESNPLVDSRAREEYNPVVINFSLQAVTIGK
jgi:hypothetical protein